MIYTGPLFFEEHEVPYDFYRYTQFAVHHLFTTTGFRIERLDWLEGYFGTVAYQLDGMARYLPWQPRALGEGLRGLALAPLMGLLKLGCGVLSVLFHRLELRTKFTGRGYPKNYIAIVRKPAD